MPKEDKELSEIDERNSVVWGNTELFEDHAQMIPIKNTFKDVREAVSIEGYKIPENNHNELADMIEEMLWLTDKLDPIEREVPLPEFQGKWRADIVGYKDGQIHTVVEIGKLSDPSKIQALSMMYPRFLWIPYVPTFDNRKLRRMLDDMERLPGWIAEVEANIPQIEQRLNEAFDKLYEKRKEELRAIEGQVTKAKASLEESKNLLLLNAKVAQSASDALKEIASKNRVYLIL